VFSAKLWPEFGAGDLEDALEEFHRRERRFGRIPEAVAG
jgi:undecaprenyl diphosphate synthase